MQTSGPLNISYGKVNVMVPYGLTAVSSKSYIVNRKS